MRSNRRQYFDWTHNLVSSCWFFKPYEYLKTVQALHELLPVINFTLCGRAEEKFDTRPFRNSHDLQHFIVSRPQTANAPQKTRPAQLQGLWETLFIDCFCCKRPHLYSSRHLIGAHSLNANSRPLKTSIRPSLILKTVSRAAFWMAA